MYTEMYVNYCGNVRVGLYAAIAYVYVCMHTDRAPANYDDNNG